MRTATAAASILRVLVQREYSESTARAATATATASVLRVVVSSSTTTTYYLPPGKLPSEPSRVRVRVRVRVSFRARVGG